jgi:hypothetical protein
MRKCFLSTFHPSILHGVLLFPFSFSFLAPIEVLGESPRPSLVVNSEAEGIPQVYSSVGWLFEFLKNCRFWLGKNLWIQELMGFHERTGKEPNPSKNRQRTNGSSTVLKFWKNCNYISKPVIRRKVWEPAGKWIYTQVDNRWAYAPHSKNCPTLALFHR